MVDVQPPFFGEKLPRADIAIDHHPELSRRRRPVEDVRTKYGATAALMTEYLVTADEKISERLATALLYAPIGMVNGSFRTATPSTAATAGLT